MLRMTSLRMRLGLDQRPAIGDQAAHQGAVALEQLVGELDHAGVGPAMLAQLQQPQESFLFAARRMLGHQDRGGGLASATRRHGNAPGCGCRRAHGARSPNASSRSICRGVQASKPGYSSTTSSKRISSWSIVVELASAGGTGSWVSMIDSTWLTPAIACCVSSGMPQMISLWFGRGMGAFYTARGQDAARRQHAENEDSPERLRRQAATGALAQPHADHGRRHGGDAGHAVGQSIGAVQGERHASMPVMNRNMMPSACTSSCGSISSDCM
jgi:hypothetical protein